VTGYGEAATAYGNINYSDASGLISRLAADGSLRAALQCGTIGSRQPGSWQSLRAMYLNTLTIGNIDYRFLHTNLCFFQSSF